MHNIIFFLLLVLHFQVFSQDSLSVKQLYEKGDFQQGIAWSEKQSKLEESDLFYTGMCYSALQNDAKALFYFDKAVALAPYNPDYLFYQGLSASLVEKFDKAIEALKKATTIRNDDPRFFGLLGEVYSRSQQYELAYQAFAYAIRLPNCTRRIFSMLADLNIYQHQLPIKEALLQAKNDSEPLASNYRNALFFLAQLQARNNPKIADSLLEHLITLDTTDYTAMVKWIQVSLSLSKFEQAERIKTYLYHAYYAQTLPPYLAKEMLIEEYEWNGKKIKVYERFDDENIVYYKYLFYVMNDNLRVDYVIQVEYSPAVREAGLQYVLGKTQNQKHYTYFQFTYPKKIAYPTLKENVLLILEGKAKATSVMTWDTGQ
ncbi:MAG: tetratricopeptide repeat protein [Bacteroidia bacterium]